MNKILYKYIYIEWIENRYYFLFSSTIRRLRTTILVARASALKFAYHLKVHWHMTLKLAHLFTIMPSSWTLEEVYQAFWQNYAPFFNFEFTVPPQIISKFHRHIALRPCTLVHLIISTCVQRRSLYQAFLQYYVLFFTIKHWE
jgi:hypothetical protein